MATQKKPSDPRTHTPAKVAAALANIGPRKVETRTITQRLPDKKPEAKAGRAIERENITKDGSVTRDRVKAPFTLPAVNRASLEEALKDMKNAGKFHPEKTKRVIPESAQRATQLDKSLEEHESHALAQYLEDRALAAANIKIGNYGESQGGTPSWDRLPMSEKTRRALTRIAHIHKFLNRDDRDDLQHFARMCVPIDSRDAMSTQELGFLLSKSDDKRVCKGAFVGAMRKIAQRLYWLYKSYQRDAELLVNMAKRRNIYPATTCHTLAA